MHVDQSISIVRSRTQEDHRVARAGARASAARPVRPRRHPKLWTPSLAATSVVLAAGLLLGSLPALSRVETGPTLVAPRPMAAPAPTQH